MSNDVDVVSVILPSMTEQMILAAFNHLVECELRKNINGQTEFWFGNQEGLIASFIIMFGQGEESTVERAYNAGRSWLHLTERIVKENLKDWVTGLAELDRGDEVDFKAMQEAVDKAVNDYALQHPRDMSDALRNL